MTSHSEALRLALEALEEFGEHYNWCHQFPTYAFPENYPPCNCGYDKAITAIKQALAQPEPEPVGYLYVTDPWGAPEYHFSVEKKEGYFNEPVYKHPPKREPEPVECMCGICKLGKREWQGLTDEEIMGACDSTGWCMTEGIAVDIARAIEDKLKEKNQC